MLDPSGQPVPVGMIGELFVGGPLVARGYRGRDKETAERFVRHPFSVLPEARVYRTGDLVRLYPNGELAFVGRHDEQVKVRGFRIELSEVEAHLQAAPGVASAAVAARPTRAAGRVSSAMSSWPTVRCSTPPRCARTCSNTCPPSWCRRPGSSTRHCHHAKRQDRSARARSVRPPEPGVGATGNAPSTSEQLLAEIWQSVLGTMRVGHDDDFFALGGHSLLAAQVVVRVRTVFGVDLPLRAVFDHPTLAALAARIEHLRGGSVGPKRRHRAPRRYRSRAAHFGQQRLWFVDMLDPGRPTYNTAAVIRIRGPLDSAAMGRAIDQLLYRHAPLRTAYTRHRCACAAREAARRARA